MPLYQTLLYRHIVSFYNKINIYQLTTTVIVTSYACEIIDLLKR